MLYFVAFCILCPSLCCFVGVFFVPIAIIASVVLFIWQIADGMDELDEQDRENKDK